METINLETTRDEAFLREVEAESGQKVTNCYQCGNCTAGCPCGPESVSYTHLTLPTIA